MNKVFSLLGKITQSDLSKKRPIDDALRQHVETATGTDGRTIKTIDVKRIVVDSDWNQAAQELGYEVARGGDVIEKNNAVRCYAHKDTRVLFTRGIYYIFTKRA